MVTFALPGDDGAEPANATPRSRPPLPFSQRGIGASPYGSFNKRAATPHTRKTLFTREEAPSGSLGRSFNGARNLFQASNISDSPPAASIFSPSIPSTTPKRVFAPGATPDPSRTLRESNAQPTPRGVAARAKDKNLFPMRISSPPRELTGEALAKKVPKDWDQKASIYADQFLADLCPPEFDEEQRRQYFCILDLRRLKYAADEIFLKKGWKLNVINFAKEFEKSRSIIMLRYGLYEFQNVKPSKEVLKRWRREHGLPDPEDEDEAAPTPSKASAKKKKRKADDDETTTPAANKNKRRATEVQSMEPPAPAAPLPSTAGKNKRKASVGEDTEAQPAKVQKPVSGARSMFEAAANKAAATPASAAPVKTNAFASSKPTNNNNLFRSVFAAKAEAAQAASNDGNPFAYLSDNSSAKNSGVEADADSDSDSDSEEVVEVEQNEEPSAKRPAITSTVETGTSSDAGTRESTPARSLFDRVTKDSDGQPVRASTPVETQNAPKDQTWNAGTTPIKFAPSTSASQPSSLFNAAGSASAPASSIFAPKSTTPANIFGSTKKDTPAEQESSAGTTTGTDKDGGESDKENDSQGSKKVASESKMPETQPSFGSSLFGQKSTSTTTTDAAKEPEAVKPAAPSIFGSSAIKAPTGAANIFGSASKPTEVGAASGPSVMSSSTLFGAKPAEPIKEPEKAPSTSEPKPSLFANAGSTANKPSAPSLFGANSAAATTSNLFGNNVSATAAKPLFGNASTTNAEASKDTTSATATAPSLFSSGGTSGEGLKTNGATETASKRLFGAPKSPPASAGGTSMFDGSPMKQDDKSPAKSLFSIGNKNTGSSTPASFSFGNTSQAPASGGIFGSASQTATNTSNSGGFSFGSGAASSNSAAPASSAPASGGFNFNFGGSSSNSAFSNPFSSGNTTTTQDAVAPSAAPGGSFSFGGSSAPPTGTSTPFQFGNGPSNTNGTPAFGATSSTPANGPSFSFGGASTQPQQNAGTMFGNNQSSTAAPLFNLQPPSGGPSTGTSKSPFPGRKILPLKRRV
jgi:hypothetical protein